MSANERVQESSRFIGGALIFTGVLALIVSIYVSGKVGWSLADDTLDRAATALILGLADFAAALLILAGSILWVWERRWQSMAALGVSVLFLAMGYLSAFGFFSSRIAVHLAQKAAIKVDQDYLAWAKGQTVNREIPRSERLSMRAEVKAANKELRATASVVSDKYAAAIATFFGWTLEATQTRLTAAIAATAYVVKFSGLWFGPIFLLRRRRQGVERSARGNTGNDGDGDGKVVPLHKPEPSTAAMNADPLPAASNSTANAAAPAAAATQRSERAVEPLTQVQQRWTEKEVDAYLTEVADSPKLSWRAMGQMMGWDHTTLFKRWQRSTGVNEGQRRPVLGHRQQHRQERYAHARPH